MSTPRSVFGLLARARRSTVLVTVLALPLSLMSAPANAQDPTPASTSAPTSKKATFSRTLQAAWDEAARTGRPVEVPSRFTETMKVWAQPDGKRLKAALYTRPVQLRNPDKGTWEPIDTRIVTRDGTLQAARVKTPLTFGQRGAKRLVAADGDRGTTAMHTTRPLPEPVISGDTVTYRDAVAPGADLVVQAQADGFISRVVFHRRPDGPVTVRLPLTVPKGTKFGKTRQGLPQLQDAKGKAVAAPIVLTAMDAKAETAPDQGKTSPVPAQVETSGDTPELVFTPDEKFLADPAVSYPVTISASSEWFGGGTPTDAWVSKNDPYSNNAAAGWLRAGTTSTSADIARVYLKFNTDAPELKGATVIDADLIIWNYKSGGPNGQLCGDPLGAGIVAQRITSDWDVRYLSWNNQPSRASETEGLNRAGYNYDASGTWCAKDEALWYRVTGMARAWIEQGVPNYGLVLRAASETAAINWRQYYSSEYSGQPYPGYRHPPTLMIEYEPAPSRTTGFLIPYKPNPTVGDAIDNTFVSPKLPEAPEMTEEDVLAARETPVDYVLEDSSLGLRPPDDMTLEEWLEDIGATHPLEPDPSPGPDPDTAPPTVIGTLPDGDQQDVPIDTQLRVSFDEPVSGAQITLRDQNGTEVAGTVTMDVDDTVAVFVPNHELSVSTGYTAEVTGAQDAAGNTMAPYTWSFTTAATAPSPSPSPSTSPTPVPGLVAAYGMDEASGTTVADSSGHGNTGTARNTTRVTTGKYGRALSFNGFSSEVVVNHSASLRLTTGMTLSAWVNPNTITDWRTVVMKELASGENASYGLYASDGEVPSGWLLTGRSHIAEVLGSTPLPINTWSHLALTYDGSKAILYVNGVPAGEISLTGSLVDDGGVLRIGANSIWGDHFSGRIDEVRIYNRALSAAEIQADMNTPVSGSSPSPSPSPSISPSPSPSVSPSPSPSPSTSPTPVPGLVAAYGMDEAFGTTVADSSGHGNTGTARNTTRVTTGKYGRALSFNGFSSEVVVNDSASLRLSTGMTLSAWVNPSTVTDWRTVLMKELDEEFIPSYGLWASADGGPMGWILTEDEAGMPASDTSLPTNTWTHLALTYNGSKAILYVNGVPVVQESVSGSIWDEGGDLRIGANITWGEYFAGLIDEVRIYNRALSAAEIQADMNTPIGPAPPTTAALATTAGPTVAKTVLSSADRLTVLVSGTEGRPASVEVEIAQQPKKSSRSKRLLWSGRTAATEKAEHTLKIPAGKVRTGETVRWRARVHVDGKPGAWSSWQETVISEPEPVSTAKDATVQAAARKFPYNHITHQECLDEVGKLERPAWEMSWSNRRWRAFKAKNSFSLCFAMWIGERDEDDEHNRFTPLFSAARWYGRLTMLFHTYVGRANGNTAARDGDPGMNSRQIKVQVKLHDFTVVGDPDEWGNRPLRIGVGQKGRSCTLSYIQNGVKVNAPYGRDAPARQWVNGLDFILDVPWDGLPHPDQVSICTVQPFVKFLGNPELDDGYWLLDPYFRDKSKITTFICDSATWIRAYTGGCVVGSIAPVFILDGNDSKVRESVRHWWAALYHADQTRPDRPYPKRIPGAWNSTNPGCRRTSSGPGGCLHRTRDPDRQMANRDDHAIPACRKIKPGYRHPDSCDEFPFATTLEGAASTTNDFSVRIIPHRDNCSSGSRTGAFYLRNRIRDHSPFWVDVILPGESRPVSGAEGVVVSDPFPEEIVNFNLCTFDGIS